MSMNLFLWTCTVCYIFATLATVHQNVFCGAMDVLCCVWGSLYHYTYQLVLAHEGM
jgi:hypothetical protein